MAPPLVITISRGIGAGGAYIGQQVAARLGILFVDREILREVARERGLPEETLAEREEGLIPVWKSILESFSNAVPDSGVGLVAPDIPTDRELFASESAFITHLAQERSAVIVGRCANWVLRNHPRHVSFFCHANDAFRRARIQALHNCSSAEAQKRIESTDRARTRYREAMTGVDVTDARQYSLCLDTGVLGLEAALELVLEYVHRRFGGA